MLLSPFKKEKTEILFNKLLQILHFKDQTRKSSTDDASDVTAETKVHIHVEKINKKIL